MPLSLAIVWLWAMGLAEPVMMSTRPDIFFSLVCVCVCVHALWTSDLFITRSVVNMVSFLMFVVVPCPGEGLDFYGEARWGSLTLVDHFKDTI